MPSLLSELRRDLGSTFLGMSICRLNSRRTVRSFSARPTNHAINGYSTLLPLSLPFGTWWLMIFWYIFITRGVIRRSRGNALDVCTSLPVIGAPGRTAILPPPKRRETPDALLFLPPPSWLSAPSPSLRHCCHADNSQIVAGMTIEKCLYRPTTVLLNIH